MKTVTADVLKTLQNNSEKFTLVNTLPEESFSKTRIQGAINIPQDSDDFEKKVEEAAGSKANTVVVYCASAECDSSAKGGKKLEEAGFTDVRDFEEGFKGWQEAEQHAGQHA